MDLVFASPYPVGKQRVLYYIDEHYKVQSMVITKEMVESDKVTLPTLPNTQVSYELYIRDGEVFVNHLEFPLIVPTDREIGEVEEPVASRFVSWDLRSALTNLSVLLKDKIKKEHRERYTLVRFVDGNTSKVLVEFLYENYYKENFALNGIIKLVDRGYSDLVIQIYNKDEDKWILFEQKRLSYWKALEDTQALVQAEKRRWRKEL